MADDKFTVIGETKIGSLEGGLSDEWDRLGEAQSRLEELQYEQEQALDAFWDALNAKFGPKPGSVEHTVDSHGLAPRFRISPEGDVYTVVCKCPICQAKLHDMTVAATVEEMYRNDLISPQKIEHIRQRARMVDKSHEMRKKMLN